MTTVAAIPRVLGEVTLAELELGLRGQLIRPSDEGYNEARAVWNGSHDGAYVNFMGDAGDERLRACYGDAKYERLVGRKRRYDPTNLFQLNQKIPP